MSQDRPNFTITARPSPTVQPHLAQPHAAQPITRPITMQGSATGPAVAPADASSLDRFRREGVVGGDGSTTVVNTASVAGIVDELDAGRQYFIKNPEAGGGATAAPGLAEAADAIEQGSKSAADALKAAMPALDDAGAKELSRLLKTAAVAKGVSVASLVLSVGDVALNWKNYGIDDPRTQDSIASLVGGSAGSAIGMALAGPLGAALGGMIGSYLGPKVADFARDLAEEYGDDVKHAVGAIADGVGAVGSSIADAADAVTGAVSDLWDGVWGDGGIIDDITPDIDIPFF